MGDINGGNKEDRRRRGTDGSSQWEEWKRVLTAVERGLGERRSMACLKDGGGSYYKRQKGGA